MNKIMTILSVLILASTVSYAEDGIMTGADIDAVLQPVSAQPPVNQMIDLQNPANPAANPATNPNADPGVNPAANPAAANPALNPNLNPTGAPAMNPAVTQAADPLNPTGNPALQNGSLTTGNQQQREKEAKEKQLSGQKQKDQVIGSWTNPAGKEITNHGMSKKRANAQKREDNLGQ